MAQEGMEWDNDWVSHECVTKGLTVFIQDLVEGTWESGAGAHGVGSPVSLGLPLRVTLGPVTVPFSSCSAKSPTSPRRGPPCRADVSPSSPSDPAHTHCSDGLRQILNTEIQSHHSSVSTVSTVKPRLPRATYNALHNLPHPLFDFISHHSHPYSLCPGSLSQGPCMCYFSAQNALPAALCRAHTVSASPFKCHLSQKQDPFLPPSI